MTACACGASCKCDALAKAIREAAEALRAGEAIVALAILERAEGGEA